MIEYRTAVSDDAALIAEFGRRTFVDAFAAQNRAEDIEQYVAKTYGEMQQRAEIEDPASLVLLALHEGTLIAYAWLRHDEIARFYVSNEWHGHGIAQELMRRIEECARSAGFTTLWLGVWEQNARAIAFYQKCGFAITGTQPFLLGNDLQTDYVMSKTI